MNTLCMLPEYLLLLFIVVWSGLQPVQCSYIEGRPNRSFHSQVHSSLLGLVVLCCLQRIQTFTPHNYQIYAVFHLISFQGQRS